VSKIARYSTHVLLWQPHRGGLEYVRQSSAPELLVRTSVLIGVEFFPPIDHSDLLVAKGHVCVCAPRCQGVIRQ